MYLTSDWILNADDKQTCHIVDNSVLVIPIRDLVDFSFSWHEIAAGHGSGAQAVTGHRFNHFTYQSLLMFAGKLFQFAVDAIKKGASSREETKTMS